MELWIDSIHLPLIKDASMMGILHGVTTNPSILAEYKNWKDVILTVLEAQKGPVTIQVNAKNADEMIEQGLLFEEISERVIVKVPVTQEGLKAIHNLSSRGIETMATVIFKYQQYLLAATAGATYAAPYYSSMENAGLKAIDEMSRMCYLRDRHGLSTKILAASIQNLDQMQTCLDIGVDAITLKDSVFQSLIEDQKNTLERMEKFLKLATEN